MADASYTPKIYKAQGGAELVVTSSGTLTLEGRMDLSSGSSMTVASGAAIGIASGASIGIASGGYLSMPVQTVSSSGTTITNYGVSVVTGTTVGPTYLISNPLTGGVKMICISASSSAATSTAIIAAASTGVSFGSTGANNITLYGAGARAVTLVGISTAAYRIVGVYSTTMGIQGNVST